MTDKFWETTNEYLTLDQAVKLLRRRPEFIIGLFQQHRLKGFRIGEDWLTTEAWVMDYRQSLHQELEQILIQAETTKPVSPYILLLTPWTQTPGWRYAVTVAGLALICLLVAGSVYLSLDGYRPITINDERLTVGFNRLIAEIKLELTDSYGQVAGVDEAN